VLILVFATPDVANDHDCALVAEKVNERAIYFRAQAFSLKIWQ
jgi:hypothetical protein